MESGILGTLTNIEEPGVLTWPDGLTLSVDHFDAIASATLFSLREVLGETATKHDYVTIVNRMMFWVQLFLRAPKEGEGEDESEG